MIGVILAGGKGSRMDPLTRAVNKHLLPVYDRPLIYYPLQLLLAAEIREVVVVTDPTAVQPLQRLLGDGRQWDARIHYAMQDEPRGLVHALLSAEAWLRDRPITVALGDNVFFGGHLPQQLMQAAENENDNRATLFTLPSAEPERYAVVGFENDQPVTISEKPTDPPSNWIVPGIYVYPMGVVEEAKQVSPSDRGETEITDLNARYLAKNRLNLIRLNDVTWFDAGTPDDLLAASNWAKSVE